MEYKVTLKIEYASGRYRQLSWVEHDPNFVIQEGAEKGNRLATGVELENAICKSLNQMMEDNTIRTFKDLITNKSVVIRFSEVSEVEVLVEEVE